MFNLIQFFSIFIINIMKNTIYYKYQLTYPFQGTKIYKSSSKSKAIKNCYREFLHLGDINDGLFYVTNIDSGEEYHFQINHHQFENKNSLNNTINNSIDDSIHDRINISLNDTLDNIINNNMNEKKINSSIEQNESNRNFVKDSRNYNIIPPTSEE